MNIKFLDQDKPVNGFVTQIAEHIIQIETDADVDISGFQLLNDAGSVFGNYEDYTTLYQKRDDGFILSNDGSVYVEPEPQPEPQPQPQPEPYVPTLEEVQNNKIIEMNTVQQETIQAGVNVTLTDGTVEHFTLTDHDQISLMGLQAKVLTGEDNIPWHTSDATQSCKFYSNADMKLITETALNYVTWHVTYFRDLRIYIIALETVEEVQAIVYGIELPEEYQSEPLKAMIAAQQA